MGGKLRVNLHPGQTAAKNSIARIVAIICGNQWGKALSTDTRIPTPSGFKFMGCLEVGDFVFGIDGKPTKVVYKSPTFPHNPCYRVTFDDGSEIIADKDHLWSVRNKRGRKNEVRSGLSKEYLLTTDEIRNRIEERWSVALPQPVQYPEGNFLIPPYLLGVWLGDGSSVGSNFTNTDPEIVSKVREIWPQVRERQNKDRSPTIYLSSGKGNNSIFAREAHELRIWDNKQIPKIYLCASIDQRMELLRGLMDTDGYCGENGVCEFTSIKFDLAQDVLELVRSLGIKARCYSCRAMLNGRDISPKYRVKFKTDKPVFSLKRKLARLPIIKSNSEVRKLFIQKIEQVVSVPTACIKVDNPDGMYLAGTSYTPTHNTAYGPHWMHDRIRQTRVEGEFNDYLAVTATYPLLDKKMLPEFCYVFEDLLHLGKYKDAKKTFEFPDGKTRVIFGSATNPDSIESATAKAAWLDEAGQSQFRRGAWDAVKRRVGLNQGRILITSTPYNLGWLKTEIHDRAKAGDEDIELIQSSSITNPAYPVEEYEKQRSIMPAWKFDMFYRGIYTTPAGLIYDSFNEVLCRIKRFEIPKDWPVYSGHDFGGANPAAIFYAQVKLPLPSGAPSYMRYGDFVAFQEYLPGGGKSTAQHVDAFREITNGYTVVERRGGNHTSEDEIRQGYTAHGWAISEPKLRYVEPKIDRVYALHKLNKIYYFDDMLNVLDEKLSYSRKLDEANKPTDEIESKSSYHLMDAEASILSDFTPETEEQGDSCPVWKY